MMEGDGLVNDPFHYFEEAGLTALPAEQLDGRDATRPSSGRRIDYILVSSDLEDAQSQVYDSQDEHRDGGLELPGEEPDRAACETASDHLPVFADVPWP